MKMYCVKCKKSMDIPEKDITMKIAKNGRKMATAICPISGTRLTMFVKQ